MSTELNIALKKMLNEKLILIDDLIFKTKVFEFLTPKFNVTTPNFLNALQEEKETVNEQLKQFESEAV